MDKFKIIKTLGDGSFGIVLMATDENGEVVAIKKMKQKFSNWNQCLELREVKSLKKLNHVHLIKLKQLIRENEELHFIFEYMEGNLYQLMQRVKELRSFHETEVRNICGQMCQGLEFMHTYGFFHRDMKPENVLVERMPKAITNEVISVCLKIADFGLAREIRSMPPYTVYVSTRWYRAPEVLLSSTAYSSPIDMWALGVIHCELYTLRPLFAGTSSIDQLYKICSLLGTPNVSSSESEGGGGEWKDAERLSGLAGIKFPNCRATGVESALKGCTASEDGTDVIKRLIRWDPNRRPNAKEVFGLPYFKGWTDQSSNASSVTSSFTNTVFSRNENEATESTPKQGKVAIYNSETPLTYSGSVLPAVFKSDSKSNLTDSIISNVFGHIDPISNSSDKVKRGDVPLQRLQDAYSHSPTASLDRAKQDSTVQRQESSKTQNGTDPLAFLHTAAPVTHRPRANSNASGDQQSIRSTFSTYSQQHYQHNNTPINTNMNGNTTDDTLAFINSIFDKQQFSSPPTNAATVGVAPAASVKKNDELLDFLISTSNSNTNTSAPSRPHFNAPDALSSKETSKIFKTKSEKNSVDDLSELLEELGGGSKGINKNILQTFEEEEGSKIQQDSPSVGRRKIFGI